ncbi:hypothetical protein AAHC03_05320 [Spirometra sp. Aus1]
MQYLHRKREPPMSFISAAIVLLVQTSTVLNFVAAPTPSASVEVKLSKTGPSHRSRTLWTQGEPASEWARTRKGLQRFPRSPLRSAKTRLGSAPHPTSHTGSTVQMHRHLRVEDTASPSSSPDDANYGWTERINHQEAVPAVSFHSVEENIIELLVVVTPRMSRVLGKRLTEYIIATMGAVSV